MVEKNTKTSKTFENILKKSKLPEKVLNDVRKDTKNLKIIFLPEKLSPANSHLIYYNFSTNKVPYISIFSLKNFVEFY